MDDNKIIKLVYSLFLGILLAIFVGVGVNTFYPGPEWPEYPSELNYSYENEPSEEQREKQKAYDDELKSYEEQSKSYSRNLSIILLAAAVALLVFSLQFEKKIKFISDGVMLGGLFTLLYSLTASFASKDDKLTFGVTTVAVVVVLFVGYLRFVKPSEKNPGKKVLKKKK
jgi:hypothetical protein